ncbi:MAG: SRPBCC family protein [Actinobacteria bacterium]|nr:SRPBCC family protein [Actinomycetota bacterium]
MPFVESSIIINGNIDEIYKIAKDMEKYPEFMPDVKSVKVVAREENQTTTKWITSVEGTPICWTEVDVFDDENKNIKYCLIEGDLDKFEGEWIFTQNSEGTKVELTVDFDFGMPTLAELLGPILTEKVRENSMMMLNSMKNKIEGLEA